MTIFIHSSRSHWMLSNLDQHTGSLHSTALVNKMPGRLRPTMCLMHSSRGGYFGVTTAVIPQPGSAWSCIEGRQLRVGKQLEPSDTCSATEQKLPAPFLEYLRRWPHTFNWCVFTGDFAVWGGHFHKATHLAFQHWLWCLPSLARGRIFTVVGALRVPVSSRRSVEALGSSALGCCCYLNLYYKILKLQ